MGSIPLVQSAVVRLRAGLVIIIVLTLATLLAGWHAISSVGEANSDLIARSLPLFVASQDFDRELLYLVQLSNRARKESEVDALRDIQVELDASLQRLHAAFEATSEENVASSAANELKETIPELHDHSANLIALGINNALLTEASSKMAERVAKMQADLALDLEVMRLATDTKLSEILEEDIVGDDRLRKLILRGDALRNIGASLISIREMVRAMVTSTDERAVRLLSRQVSFEMKGAIKALLRLSDDPERRALAEDFRAIFRSIDGDEGVEQQQTKLVENSAMIEDVLRSQFVLLQSINQARGLMNIQTHDEINASVVASGKSVADSLRLFAVVGAAVVGLSLAVMYIVVERQINQRMPRLAQAVRDITEGREPDTAKIAGDDEIGEIRDALSIFEKNASELRRSNEELSRFAYAASHDLRSPLRAIRMLAEWTLMDFGDLLPQEGKDNLVTLTERVTRLSKLLDDLLAYARVGLEGERHSSVNLKEVVDTSCFNALADAPFNIIVEAPAKAITVQSAPLQQVLMNLVANAIRHHDRQTGEIRVTAEIKKGCLWLSVSDDGPGIETDYHDRIFGLFETLRTRDAVEGSGMGLAIIKKTIDAIGGSIEVISNPEVARGTTFRVDWPLPLQAQELREAA